MVASAATPVSTARAMYADRHPYRSMRKARNGAPTSNDSAHEVSKMPIARPREEYDTRSPMKARPATVRLLTPTMRNAIAMPKVTIDPPRAITEEAVTSRSEITKTSRWRPRSSVFPKSGVVSPPSSVRPRIPVIVPVEVENARSNVGRNAVTQRRARFEVDFDAVRVMS